MGSQLNRRLLGEGVGRTLRISDMIPMFICILVRHETEGRKYSRPATAVSGIPWMLHLTYTAGGG